MDYDDVYAQVRTGDMSEEKFLQWCRDFHQESYEMGYQEGVDEE